MKPALFQVKIKAVLGLTIGPGLIIYFEITCDKSSRLHTTQNE
jgi:hypothetical protein